MIQIFNDRLSIDDVRALLDYFYIEDETVDARPDVRSKHPQWDSEWPRHIIKNALDDILDSNYHVEEVVLFDTRISYSLHVDSGKSINSRKGQVIIFPLFVDGIGSTALFDNHWYRDSTRFSKVRIEPFEYNLPNRFKSWTYIKDLRILLDQCFNSPDTINDFVVDEEFISTLRYLIYARQDLKTSKVDGRCYDYTDIVGYDPQSKFNKQIHDQNFTHIPIETLHGLTLNSIIQWNVGSCFAFERTRLHCACSGHNKKIGLTIFTQRFD